MSYADDLARDRDKAKAQAGALIRCLRAIVEDTDAGIPLGPKVLAPARKLLKSIDAEAVRVERALGLSE